MAVGSRGAPRDSHEFVPSRSRDFPSRAPIRVLATANRSIARPPARPSVASIRSSVFVLPSLSLATFLFFSAFSRRLASITLRRGERTTANARFLRVYASPSDERQQLGSFTTNRSSVATAAGSRSLPLPLSLPVSTLLRVLTFARSLARSLTRSFVSLIRSFVCRVRGAPTNTRSRRPLFALGPIVLTGRTADKRTDVFVQPVFHFA